DALEAIDVEQQQRHALAEAIPPLDGVNETRVQMPAVERTGQRIRERFRLEPANTVVKCAQADHARGRDSDDEDDESQTWHHRRPSRPPHSPDWMKPAQ